MSSNPASENNPKKIINVEILYLDETGYGHDGLLTRREWRELCLEKLLAGIEIFNAWQSELKSAFNNEIALSRANFDYRIFYDDGSNERYSDYLNFQRIDFVGLELDRLNVCGYIFLLPVDFSCVIFKSSANFSSAIFEDVTIFRSANFTCFVSFIMATFKYKVYFNRVILSNVDFDSVIFSDYADFCLTTFSNLVGFSSANFKAYSNFNFARFNDDVLFTSSIFENYSNFRSTIFKGAAHFKSVQFLKAVDFFNSEFRSECRFDSKVENNLRLTEFGGKVNFENVLFKNVGHFEQVKFNGEIPSFLGVDIANTRLEFSDVSFFTKDDWSEDAIKNLGQLKRLADEHGQIDQALMFNALELNAKKNALWEQFKTKNWCEKVKSQDWWENWFTEFYDKVSDYGCSILSPLRWYFRLMCITFFLTLFNASIKLPEITSSRVISFPQYLMKSYFSEEYYLYPDKTVLKMSALRAAAEYTIYRSVGILDITDNDKSINDVFNRLFSTPIEPWWMRIWGVFKALVSAVLLFLIALGLRNKFRIK